MKLYDSFIPLGDKKGDKKEKSVFVPFYSNGVKTNRDAWVYNFYNESLVKNMKESIRLYMEGLKDYKIRSQGAKQT